jgi:hypothetical protein
LAAGVPSAFLTQCALLAARVRTRFVNSLALVKEGDGVLRSCDKPTDLDCFDCEEFDDCDFLDPVGDELETLEYSHTLEDGWIVENSAGEIVLQA